MKKIVKLVLISIEVCILFLFIGATTTAITKHIHSQVLIEQFKHRGTLDASISTNMVKLYPIASDEEIPTCYKNGSNVYPGYTGDILISLVSEIETPVIHDIVSFYAGGHAAVVLGDYEDIDGTANMDQTLESTGLVDDIENAFVFSKNLYWVDMPIYKEVIGLRVSMSDQDRKRILTEAMAMIGEPYNYSFIIDTDDKSYCTDIITKIYHKIGINLNKDGFTTSVYDLLVSKDSYISYYHYIDSEGVKHVYYLD